MMSQNQQLVNAYDYNLMIQNLSINFTTPWSSMTLPSWYVQDLKMIGSAYNQFRSNHRSTENWLNKIDFLLLLLGVFGNMAALTTMFKRRSSMGTPSFVYHKALVAADLVFCVNFLFMKFVEQSTRHSGSKIYTTYALAFYAIFVNRALSSTCGYIVLYMSLAISFDRFVAIWYYNWYPRFNKSIVALSVLLTSLILSSAVNSWAIWVERVIVDLKLDPNSVPKFRQDETSETIDPLNADQYSNSGTGAFYETYDSPAPLVTKSQRGASTSSKFSTVLYMAKLYSTPSLSKLIWMKNVYNMVLRVAYPLALTFLTGMVILGFVMREKRRRRYEIEKQNFYESMNQMDSRKASEMYNYSNNININNTNDNTNNITIPNGKPFVTCSPTATSSSGGASHRLNNGSMVPGSSTFTVSRFSTSRRRDRALYYLMVAVVILDFCQVVPREAKRLFEFIYPMDYTISCMEGPPGTGKTSTANAIIRRAFAARQKILITAPSNTAVDNIIRSLLNSVPSNTDEHREIRYNITRLCSRGKYYKPDQNIGQYDSQAVALEPENFYDGQVSAVNRRRLIELKYVRRQNQLPQTGQNQLPQSAKLNKQEDRKADHSFHILQREVIRQKMCLVFTTCNGAADARLRGTFFDLVIINEAAQDVEPSTLIPLMRLHISGRACLLGDHCQLGPCLMSDEAESLNFSLMLFERLLNMNVPFVMLNEQYRMHSGIGSIVSELMYKGALKNAINDDLRTLHQLPHGHPTKMTGKPFLWVHVPTPENNTELNKSVENVTESLAVVDLAARCIMRDRIPGDDIVIISSYSAQVNRIRAAVDLALEYYKKQPEILQELPKVRIGTVDGFQDKSDRRTMQERLFCFNLLAYGHLYTKLLLNTLTAANRSLVFYVYFALNRCFRKAVLQTFGLRRRTSTTSSRRRSSRRRRSSMPPTAAHRRLWNNGCGQDEPMLNGAAGGTASATPPPAPLNLSQTMISSGL